MAIVKQPAANRSTVVGSGIGVLNVMLSIPKLGPSKVNPVISAAGREKVTSLSVVPLTIPSNDGFPAP
jgi:hypothetical protein